MRRLLLVLVLAPGCITAKLWERYDDTVGPTPQPTTSRHTATDALEAVRTSDGAYHVRARCTDGVARHFVVEPLQAAPVASGTWPSASHDAPQVWVTSSPLPAGRPVRCRERTSLDVAPDPDGGDDVLAVDDGAVVLVTPDGDALPLAGLPEVNVTHPAVGQPPSRARRVGVGVVWVLLTPLALAIDGAIGAAIVGAYALPYAVAFLH